MTEEVVLTAEGYEKLVAERDELVSVRRKEVSERLKEARSYGDLSENAEYDAAKDEQAELEERIRKIDEMLRSATIINEAEVGVDQVNVGLVVEVMDLGSEARTKFVIVGSTEVDPFAEPARISTNSMVGRALIGKKLGDKVEIHVHDGILHYQVTKIERQS